MPSGNTNEIGRRKPSHGVFTNSTRPPIVFLTVCTKSRRHWLADETVHASLLESWREATAWRVGRYVLMPDHLHLFCTPYDETISLENWIQFWKRGFSQRIKNKTFRWQPQHWDTRLRHDENYSEKWEYILQNPIRAGLVYEVSSWPYHGELNSLPW